MAASTKDSLTVRLCYALDAIFKEYPYVSTKFILTELFDGASEIPKTEESLQKLISFRWDNQDQRATFPLEAGDWIPEMNLEDDEPY